LFVQARRLNLSCVQKTHLGGNVNLQRAIETFDLYMSGSNYSDTTRDLYAWALGLLVRFLEDPPLLDVGPEDLDRFWGWVRHDYKPHRTNGKTEPLAGRSLENIWTAERSFFGWLTETGRLSKRPDLNIKKPEYAPREILPFTEAEVMRLLEGAKRTKIAKTDKRTPFTMPRSTAKRDIAMIMVFVDTGIRASELARLKREDIDFNQSEITIQPFGTGRKTKQRALAIGKSTRLALWEYLLHREEKGGYEVEPGELVFVTHREDPMNKDSIRQVINEIGVTAGVPDAHPHRFRHTFASEAAANDVTEFNLMADLGHTTSKMARRYVHLKDRRRKRDSVMDKIKRGK
jgi:integrase/recombinase XerD